ncbi:MAG: acyl-CoA dehydrogenase family protein, partial [Streptomyces sp.]|nr:acyl-CoA dehydrogenase family protein [Streptomyces sp.]
VALDFGTAGLFGPLIEERYGGTALRLRDLFRVLEQLMAVDAGLATWVGSSVLLGTRAVSAWGGDLLRDRWLPPLAEGRVLGAYAQTEPGAGSDFSGITTRAHRTADGGFRLTGTKHWIGNGTWAGVVTVVARTSGGSGSGSGSGAGAGARRRGAGRVPGGIGAAPSASAPPSAVTALAVPTTSAGVCPGAEHLTLGLRGMVQSRLRFDDVAVAADAELGDGRGRAVAFDSMGLTRLAVAACAVGAMKRCVQLFHRYATRRAMSGVPLADRAATRAALATMIARTDTADALVYGLADRLDEGQNIALEPVVAAKVLASEWAVDSADALVQLLGGRGYDEANLAGRLHRDVRVYRIFEGATEALADFLGRRALARPAALHRLLATECGPDVAARVAAALARLRERGADTEDAGVTGDTGDRPGDVHNAPVARAVMWALASAAAQRAPAHAARYAAQGLDTALAALDGPRPRLLTATEVEATLARYERRIADPDFALPGADLDLDPLLRPRATARPGPRAAVKPERETPVRTSETPMRTGETPMTTRETP